jgi:hypothetical protein
VISARRASRSSIRFAIDGPLRAAGFFRGGAVFFLPGTALAALAEAFRFTDFLLTFFFAIFASLFHCR